MGKPMNQEVKIKLYLLAVGLLILAFLLVRDAGKEKKEEPVKEEGPFTAEEDLEPEPEEEEPQVKLPVYNGKIRVLLKTDEFAEEVHASVQLASDQELAVLERAAGEETGGYRKASEEKFGLPVKRSRCGRASVDTSCP